MHLHSVRTAQQKLIVIILSADLTSSENLRVFLHNTSNNILQDFLAGGLILQSL